MGIQPHSPLESTTAGAGVCHIDQIKEKNLSMFILCRLINAGKFDQYTNRQTGTAKISQLAAAFWNSFNPVGGWSSCKT